MAELEVGLMKVQQHQVVLVAVVLEQIIYKRLEMEQLILEVAVEVLETVLVLVVQVL